MFENKLRVTDNTQTDRFIIVKHSTVYKCYGL